MRTYDNIEFTCGDALLNVLTLLLRERPVNALVVVRAHLAEQEFRDFLTCGVLAHGFARLRCGDCAFERLVPFS